MNDLNIINAHICDKDGLRREDIGIQDGKIVQLSDCGKLDKSGYTEDMKGKTIFPAMIDTHTHIRGGVFSYREDFSSGTKAAASGGVGTFFEMPGGKIPCVTPKAFEQRKAEIKRDSVTDFRMYAGAGYDNIGELNALAECGAVGFKTFMNPPLPGREKEFYGLCAPDEASLELIMQGVKKSGLTLEIHCEDFDIIKSETERLRAEGMDGAGAYFMSHPDISEIKAVETAVRCAAKTGCRVNIAHVSTAEAADIICRARAKGIDVCGETTMHYLFYTAEEMKDLGCWARMKPPFRSKENRDELLERIIESDFFYIGSDHAPFTKEEKHPHGTIWQAADGLAGIEMSFRLLLELVHSGKMTMAKAAELSSFNACKRFGIRCKGLIKVGYDADLTAVKLDTDPYFMNESNMHTRAAHNGVIYSRTPLHSIINSVYVSGKKIYGNGAAVMCNEKR